MAPEMTESRFRLTELSNQMGSALLRLIYVPHERDVCVQNVAIVAPHDEVPTAPETLALIIGPVDATAVESVLQTLTSSPIVAVAVREIDDGLEQVVAAARRSGIALAFVPRAVSWERLYTVLRTAVHSRPIRPAAESDRHAGDLFALANALAATLASPVTIDDPQFSTLAYSDLSRSDSLRRESVLARKPPNEWIERLTALGVMNHLRRPGEIVHVPVFTDISPASTHPRLGIAIQAGSELLGYIWVEEITPTSDDGRTALQESARIASLYILRDSVITELIDVDKQHATEELLAGDATAAARLAIPDQWELIVAAVGTDPAHDIPRNLLHLAQLAFAPRTHVAYCWIDRTLFIVCAEAPGARDLEGVKRFAQALIAQSANRERLSIKIGFSQYGSVAIASRLHRQALQALRTLTQFSDTPDMAAIDDIRKEAVSIDVADLVRNSPVLNIGKLGDFLHSTTPRDVERIRALGAYLQHMGNSSAAAHELGVPINTLRYRLDAALRVIEIDLANPTDRLIAELQLLAWRVNHGNGG